MRHRHTTQHREMLEEPRGVQYLCDILALFFPKAHEGIDWDREHGSLDKELEQVVRDAELGRRLIDKLVRVWRKDGEEELVLVHVEVQGQKTGDFAPGN